MYCSVDDIRMLLLDKIKIGDQNIGTPVPGRESGNRSSFNENDTKKFIEYSQEYIDAVLRPMYVTPLRRIKTFETVLIENALSGSLVTVSVRDARLFSIGETVRFQNPGDMETAIITSVSDKTTFVVDSLSGNYYTENGDKVGILEFPDPIKITTARLTVSYMFDKLFNAEQEPDISNYGKSQRNMARDALDGILSGEIRLFGQEMTGRRFIRGSLLDGYTTPNFEFQKNTDNEN